MFVAYFLGIDGGGSKTTCLIGDERNVLATATTGGSNITRVGEEAARASLHQAIRQACIAAGIGPAQLTASWVGAAGAGRKERAAIVRRMIAEIIPTKIQVVGDMEIALHAAFGTGAGIVVIAGTGSIAYGRNHKGDTARAGGWGFSVSDEGSAYWIGRTAVAALLHETDRSSATEVEASKLFSQIMPAWNIQSIQQLAAISNRHPNFAELFPAIVSAAEEGCIVSRSVLKSAAEVLVSLAATVARKLFSPNPPSIDVAMVAMTGGVFRHSKMVREEFSNAIQKINPGLQVNPEVVDPAAGALQMARLSVCAKT